MLAFDLSEIVENLPNLTTDIQLVWNLLLKTFGDDAFNPYIMQKFPNNFKTDAKGENAALKAIKENCDKEIYEIRKKITEEYRKLEQ